LVIFRNIIENSYKACGDNVLDTNFGEQCDDGNTANGDGCKSDCTLETLPRVHTWKTVKTTFSQETLTNTDVPHVDEADCQSPYLPTETNLVHNPKPTSGYVCYIGKHCDECTKPRWPGYPLQKQKFLYDSPYAFIPSVNRGRFQAIVDGEEIVVSMVSNGYTLLKGNSTDMSINHNNIGPMRLSLGKYYFESKGTTVIQIYKMDATKSPHVELIHESNKVTPPLLGNDFFMYWYGPNLLMARQYNGRNIEFYALHSKTPDTFANPTSYENQLKFNEVIVPPLEIPGDILMDPVIRSGKLYVPLYIEDFTGTSKVYQFSIYESKMPWYITKFSDVAMPKEILSVASFKDAVIATVNDPSGPFYNVDTGSKITPTFSGTAPTCDTTVAPTWKFLQNRLHPDSTAESPDVWVFCEKTKIYPVTFVSGTLTIDITNGITLPDDQRDSRNKNGRYNMAYPYDINGNYLINFSIHPCSTYVMYKWDEWDYMSVAIYDLVNKITKCFDIPLTDATFL